MIIIYIAGAMGSGKSTVAQKLINMFPKHYCSLIQIDENAQAEKINADIKAANTTYVIAEGRTAHHFCPVGSSNSIKVFIDADLDHCLIRSIKKARDKDKFLKDYEQRGRKYYDQHIAPQKNHADLIVANNSSIGDLAIIVLADTICNRFNSTMLHRKQPNILSPTFDSTKTTTSRLGTVYVISGPSGVGKSSIINRVIQMNPDIEKVVPYTTRKKREEEIEGVHYHFITHDQFEDMLRSKPFLQCFRNEVTNVCYGTPMEDVVSRINLGKSIMLDVYPDLLPEIKEKISCVRSVFICPPSMGDLASRLMGRDQTVEPDRYRRAQAMFEEASFRDFDYLILNENLESSCAALSAIVSEGESALVKQQEKNADLLRQLKVHRTIEALCKSSDELNTFNIKEYRSERLSSLNNTSIKITQGANTFFMRIPGLKSQEYRAEPAHEREGLQRATSLGLYPRVIHFNMKDGTYLAPYLKDYQTLPPDRFKNSAGLCNLVVEALKKLHETESLPNDYSPLFLIESCLIRLRKMSIDLPQDMDHLAVQCHRLFELLSNSSSHKTPCNNDISPYNILYNETKNDLQIADWECTGNNDPLWDLAKFSIEVSLNEEQDLSLLSRYYAGEPNQKDTARFQLFKILIEFNLSLWAKWQAATENTAASCEQYDNMFYVRLDNCRKHFSSTAFKNNLSTIIQAQPVPRLQLAQLQYKSYYDAQHPAVANNTKQPSRPVRENMSTAESLESAWGLIIIKPDMLIKDQIGAVINEFERRNYHIVAIKQKSLTHAEILSLYPKVEFNPVKYDLMDFMTSAPVILLVVEATKDEINSLCVLKGATNPAQSGENTLRRLFGTNPKWNAIHCSDNNEIAKHEIALFFTREEICARSLSIKI